MQITSTIWFDAVSKNFSVEGKTIPFAGVRELVKMSPGWRIPPIKVLRMLFGIGLKNAKDMVDFAIFINEIVEPPNPI